MKTFFNSPNVEYGPSWPFSHLFSGRVYTNGDEERFVLWHKTPEHIVEVSGKLLPIKGGHFPLIEKIKLGIQAAPRGGVPHWGIRLSGWIRKPSIGPKSIWKSCKTCFAL